MAKGYLLVSAHWWQGLLHGNGSLVAWALHGKGSDHGMGPVYGQGSLLARAAEW